MTQNISNTSDAVRSMLTPGLFARTASRGHWQMARMHSAIDTAITDTITGRTEPVLIIETPPRHGKSELISKYLPAWFLCCRPERQVILASATADLAAKWGRQGRSIVREWGRLFGVGVSEDRGSADDWETTAGGGMRTAGVGGDVMGRGGHLLIIDDYIKNAEEAFSKTIRDKQWDWWNSTFSTRLEPEGCVVVMATRWHEDDLIGRLLKAADAGEGLPVRRVRLPAVAEDDDPLGRKPGEALWPERWPLGPERGLTINGYGRKVVGLNSRRSMVGPHWWGSLYQQRPTRDGLTAWPEAYFGDVIWPAAWPDAFELSAIAVDPSRGRDSKKGDYTAIVFAGVSGERYYVDAVIGRFPPTELVRQFLRMAARYRPTIIGFESNGFQDLFRPIIDQEASRNGMPPLGIVPLEHGGDKVLRIDGRLDPLLANDKFRFKDSPGCRELVRQLRDFPLADHDDGPDGLEMAIDLLMRLCADQYADADSDELIYT